MMSVVCLPIYISICSHGRKIPISFSAQTKKITSHKVNANFNPTPSLVKFRLAGKPNCRASEKNPMELAGGLDPELMPKHVAVIMDGNRKGKELDDSVENIKNLALGIENMRKLAGQFKSWGVEVLSLYLFTTEWNRLMVEGEFVMKMAERLIQKHMEELMGYDVRLSIVGDKTQFPKSLQDLIDSSVERAKNNKGPRLVLAVGYSGRYDITQATKRIAGKVKEGILQAADINEDVFEQHLDTNGLDFPNPDLLIRTGNKFDVGNYMLWQLAYTELHFSEKIFTDFNEEDVVEALAAFQRRRRRFGGA